MTATSKNVRGDASIRQSGTTSGKSRPDKPRADMGPRAYGQTQKGRYIVIRFVVSQMTLIPRPGRKWWVLDMDEKVNRGIAAGTAKEGYDTKEEAIKVARKYRDTYGAWARCIF